MPETGTAFKVPDLDRCEIALGCILRHEGEHPHPDQYVKEVDAREDVVIHVEIIGVDDDTRTNFLGVLGDLDDREPQPTGKAETKENDSRLDSPSSRRLHRHRDAPGTRQHEERVDEAE